MEEEPTTAKMVSADHGAARAVYSADSWLILEEQVLETKGLCYQWNWSLISVQQWRKGSHGSDEEVQDSVEESMVGASQGGGNCRNHRCSC
ncbi:hypothetical protein OIU78_025927 [Salix suchowensis]|nr:hypothetical protein OIU78_025927 [Salix suchowensis]